MCLYNLVTDNFKEYDFDTEYCLNIYITPPQVLVDRTPYGTPCRGTAHQFIFVYFLISDIFRLENIWEY